MNIYCGSKNNMIKDDLSIVIFGYDPYAGCWPAFEYFANKNLPTNEIETFFVSGEKPYISSCGIKSLLSKDLSFSSRLESALENIKTKYVLILLEDYLPYKTIKVNELNKMVSLLRDKNIDFLQIDNISEIPNKKAKKEDFKTIRKRRKHYLINLQPSIWKVETLKSTLPAEYKNLFEFETKINKNSIIENWEIFKLKPLLNSFANLIIKGKMNFYVHRHLIEKNNLDVVDFKITSKCEIKKIIFIRFLLKITPSFIRRFVKKIGRAFGKKYYSDS